MLKTLAFSLFLTTFLVASASGQTNWKLVWSDEFNGPQGTAPDSSKWAFENGPGSNFNPDEIDNVCPPGSNTAPCSTSTPNIFQDGNGNLVIQAINTNGTWTSGRMKTAGIAQEQFKYGRIEARMKLPVGDGLWPAFWMLGTDLCTVTPVKWPQCGEQDIMEWVQGYGPYQTSSTIHGPGYFGGSAITKTTPFPNGGRTDDAGYHIYGVIWSQDHIQFYRDDYTTPVFNLTPASLPTGDQWVFNQQFYIILDLAIGGGGFPGFTDSSTPSTATMLVDYVRVFTADGDGFDSTAWYNLVNHNSTACVDAANYGTTNGTAVQQWTCGAQQHNQEWQFRTTDSGYYKIVSRSAASQGEVWDVTNLGTPNGTPIQLWQFGGGTNQQWEPISLGNGLFEFTDRASGGRCLDVPGGSIANGARLQIYDCNGTQAQKWTLIPQP
jgi:beta-glucanase (GH16 family)